MIPTLDGTAFSVALLLIALAVAATVINVVVFVAGRRGGDIRRSAMFAGAVTAFAFSSLILLRFMNRAPLESYIVGFFFLPVLLGLFNVLLAIRSSTGAARRWGIFVLVAAVTLSVFVVVEWRRMSLRDSLFRAVWRQQPHVVIELLAAGAASQKEDAFFRQRLLVKAAQDVNSDIVTLLLAAGADPNGRDDNTTPLIAAIGSATWTQRDPISEEDLAPKRLRTVKALLDGGADPEEPRDQFGQTPSELAWINGKLDLLALLDAKGAKDARALPARFEELMEAATRGDTAKVATLVKEIRHQRDGKWRSPIIAAAANGQADTLRLLLQHYGEDVSCELVDAATRAAAERGDLDAFQALLQPCFNVKDSDPLAAAAAAGRIDMIEAALSRGYGINTPAGFKNQTALEAAREAKQEKVVEFLVARGAK